MATADVGLPIAVRESNKRLKTGSVFYNKAAGSLAIPWVFFLFGPVSFGVNDVRLLDVGRQQPDREGDRRRERSNTRRSEQETRESEKRRRTNGTDGSNGTDGIHSVAPIVGQDGRGPGSTQTVGGNARKYPTSQRNAQSDTRTARGHDTLASIGQCERRQEDSVRSDEMQLRSQGTIGDTERYD